MLNSVALLALSLCVLPLSFAQSAAPPSQPAQVAVDSKAVDSKDVKDIDSILAALYDVISGPAGHKRDWERFRALLHPSASMIAVGMREGQLTVRSMTPEEFVSASNPVLEKTGFFEREIARHTDRYGHIVQVFSTYESRHAPGEQPFTRGINSIQLLEEGKRWWIINILWESERPDNPIPPEYRDKGK